MAIIALSASARKQLIQLPHRTAVESSRISHRELLPDSPAATGDLLLNAALRQNKSLEACIIAQINHDNSNVTADSHKLPRGVHHPPHIQQLLKADENRVASTAAFLKQQQTHIGLNKESFRKLWLIQQLPE